MVTKILVTETFDILQIRIPGNMMSQSGQRLIKNLDVLDFLCDIIVLTHITIKITYWAKLARCIIYTGGSTRPR